MPRILLPVLPFAGHVTPMLAVAAELVRRGNEVTAYTGAKYAPRFTAVGAGWGPRRQAPDFDDADLAATFPQVGNARRVAWSGVGVDLRTGRPRGARVRAAVGRVLADPGMRTTARRLSDGLEAAGGAARAAELVEGVLAAR